LRLGRVREDPNVLSLLRSFVFAEMIAKLEEEHKGKDYARHVFQDSIDLAARALTMVDLGSDDLTWSEGSLRQFLERQFPTVPSLDCEKDGVSQGFQRLVCPEWEWDRR
jgi:hypothetical protein